MLRQTNRAPNGHYLIGGQFVILLLAACLPSLGAHIGNIIQMGAQEQVIRPDARRIVATMQDEQSIGNWAVVENPTGTRGDDFSITTAFADGAVTADVVFADPNPALLGLLNVAPKSNVERVREASGQCRVLSEPRTCSLHTATGDCPSEQVISSDYRRVSAVALTDVVTVAEPHAVIGNNFELSKTLTNQGEFSRYSIGSFNVVFSGGRPATTGAHCDYLPNPFINCQE